MKDFYNINKKPSDDNGASIIKVIRPGSDEYDKVHEVDHTKRKTEDLKSYEETILYLLKDDKYVNEFIRLYREKVNENIVSGKFVTEKAYALYNLFKGL